MRKNSMFCKLPRVLCIVLIAAMTLLAAGCAGTPAAPTDASVPVNATENASATVLGEGEKVITVKTADLEGVETTFEVHTNAATVGEALTEVKLIEGHDSEYGLYVDTVNGITLDWEKDGKYWAFYVDGEYAATGVDTTEITAGAVYSFRAE